jgi:hypothetical protein
MEESQAEQPIFPDTAEAPESKEKEARSVSSEESIREPIAI